MPTATASVANVVILGGGFGGLRAAKALADAPCKVTLIDRSNHHLFQPLLYQVATAGLSPGEIAAPIRRVVGAQRNTEVLMAEVIGIDQTRQLIKLRNAADVHYDFLIIATGSKPSYFAHPEWEELAPGLKSIADATRIRRNILSAYEAAELETDEEKRRALLTIILVGAGPTGVEMAGSIAELAHKALSREFHNFNPSDTRILLIEAGPRILPTFPESLAASAHRGLEKMGVEIMTNTRVSDINEAGVQCGTIHIPSKTIVWSAGVTASSAANWLNLEADRSNRVRVDEHLRVLGSKNIFAIGDTAAAPANERASDATLPGVAAVAIQEGIYVGNYLKALLNGDTISEKFHYHDKGSLAAIGRAFAVARLGRVKLVGVIAWLIWLFVHIMYLIGFRNRLLVLIQWAAAYFTYQRGVRLIVGTEPFNHPAPPSTLIPDGAPSQYSYAALEKSDD